MADSTPYDYSSWQFYDTLGQQTQFAGMDEDFCIAPFDFPPHSAEGEMLLGLGSDNCPPHDLRGGTSAKMGTSFVYASQSHSDAAPMEMLDIDTGLGFANHELDFVDPFTHGKKPCTPVTGANNTNTNNNRPFSSDFTFLRSTSQNATERALFMTIPSTVPTAGITSPSASSASPASHLPHYQSPILDCSSPGTTPSHSEDDWDREIHHFYGLPETPPFARSEYQSGFPHKPARVHSETPPPRNWDAEEELTPLEMPDGSIRFTANWLPVDPQGGFTIGTESVSPASAMTRGQSRAGFDYGRDAPQAHGYRYDPMPVEFSKEAFIMMPV
ncbi:uncharacterized protein ACLA_032910 [Aspergillus clavatus NRRL 1]|uniref:C6 transcription factor, putative n=1 Tax=Aspergillus clavatus (strain ATCC 1007 / CBS 513.65 / DSM 816 / NCTC 3887 / NRRL 1 / QM 1276 / 107) TaxID=344612 RepID=A1CSD4_ASPCL|nr:C6 transcription factor, putative [Aspergillus clavatus NRRL 1]EAW08555.1 C6 transcription factor, putative [Aspergillus clavatus NRRL 1]